MTETIVLGAGMAGIGAALALQTAGQRVVVVDRRAPGEETSHGNAGIIQSEAAEPYPLPRDPATLLRYALGRSNDVAWTWRGLTLAAPSLLRYFGASAPRRHAAVSVHYAALTRRATADHAPLIEAAGAGALIRRTGFYQIYREAARLEQALADAARLSGLFGVAYRGMDAAALAREEPGLRPGAAGALHWPEPWSCSDPGALVRAYATLFTDRGGRLVTGDASSLARTGAGWQMTTSDGPLSAERAVVALGPWAPDLLTRFGYRVPMIRKRGYHAHFTPKAPLHRPFLDTSHGVVVSPMVRGVRVTTGAELTAPTAPARDRQLARGRAGLDDLIDLGPEVADARWFGHRPCLPRMLPVVGPAPRHDGLWLCFGHGHQGFTLGPTTGVLLAEMMAGRRDALTGALALSG
ncbi:NAD(P)/FAD-dependent oxidoreductase [Acidimangrovimonas sediminis]|uniref:NAD(P)/FAD-dependent oxidoreductase n=1 Tax=Acidimangrovimonas sediminis TaxID=2056283 RepID=UPI000C808A7F|nr:FAD-dependent oxidoreductase [Acidimangrovimonas sediminis]